MKSTEHSATIRHQSINLETSFAAFTANIESLLGRFNYDVYPKLLTDPAAAKAELEAAAGAEGLMLFSIQEHGELLNLCGQARLAKQYILGNPLIAVQMTKNDIRAALYAPLRLLAYENEEQQVTVEYDLPSSVFGQFGNKAVTAVALDLDHKLSRLVRQAAS